MTGLGQTLRGEARDALIFTGSNLVNRLGGLLLLPLYWTKLAPEDYGVLAVIAIIGAFQTLLSAMSLDLAITRFYYEWTDDVRSKNLGAIWTWNWLATLIVTVAFLLILPVVAPVLFPDVADLSWLALGIVANAIGNLFVIPASTIRIKRLPWLFASYNLLGFAVGTGIGLWLVLGQNQGLVGMIVSMLASNLVLAVIGGIAMLRFSRPGLSSPGLGEAVRFSSRALPAALINTLAAILDRFLLGLFTNLQTLGLYAVALRFADVIGVLHASLKMAFGPFLMKNIAAGGERGKDLVVAVTPYYLIPYFSVGVGISLFIGPFIRLVHQPEYLGVEAIVPWLVGVSVLGSLYFYYCNGLFFAKRTELLSVPATANLVALVASSLLLIGPFQLKGLIASRYLAATVLFGLSLYLSQRVFRLDHRWGPLVRLGVAGGGVTLVGLALRPADLPIELAVKAVILVAFVAISPLLVGGRRDLPSLRTILRPQSQSTEAASVATVSTVTPEDGGRSKTSR